MVPKKYYASIKEKEAIDNPEATPMNHNNCKQGKISVRVLPVTLICWW